MAHPLIAYILEYPPQHRSLVQLFILNIMKAQTTHIMLYRPLPEVHSGQYQSVSEKKWSYFSSDQLELSQFTFGNDFDELFFVYRVIWKTCLNYPRCVRS